MTGGFRVCLGGVVGRTCIAAVMLLTSACGIVTKDDKGDLKLNTALIHIKDDKKETLAKDAQTAWAEMKLTELMARARANMAAHVEKNVAAVAESENLRRQRFLKNVVFSKWTIRDAFGIGEGKEQTWQRRREILLEKSKFGELSDALDKLDALEISKNLVATSALMIKRTFGWTPPLCLSKTVPGAMLPASALKTLKPGGVPVGVWKDPTRVM